MQSIEKEAAQRPAAAAACCVPRRCRRSPRLGTLFTPPLLSRMIVGCGVLITINTLIYGFVTWLPVFFIQQGLTIANSFGYALVMALGAPGRLRDRRADRRPLGPQADHHRRLARSSVVARHHLSDRSRIRCCCRRSASC